jgi:hypothetical protein
MLASVLEFLGYVITIGVDLESRLELFGGLSYVVMLGGDLQINLCHVALRGFVFNPQIRQRDLAVDYFQFIVCRHLRLAFGVFERRQVALVMSLM